MAKIVKGVLYKKIKDSSGKRTGRVPFLPKTLSKFVIREDGTNVEDTLKIVDKIKDAKTYITYTSKDEYDAARESGEIKEGVLGIIPRNDLVENATEPSSPEESGTIDESISGEESNNSENVSSEINGSVTHD